MYLYGGSDFAGGFSSLTQVFDIERVLDLTDESGKNFLRILLREFFFDDAGKFRKISFMECIRQVKISDKSPFMYETLIGIRIFIQTGEFESLSNLVAKMSTQ